jgi:hypothetical protein
MTGLETTGVVVTAHYCVALIERLHAYYQRVQAGPERFRVQAESVNELIHTIELIKETESLDTPLVSRQLKTILDCLQKLDKLLKQALKDTESRKVDRFWKGLWTAKRGIQISDTFASLEEKKSSLSLCILQSAATSVDRIEKAITKQQPGQDHHIKEQWMEAGETPEDKSKIPRSMSDEVCYES